MEYRRTTTITDLDWGRLFRVYEDMNHCRIDGAVEQSWWDENKDTISRRLGACWVYTIGGSLGGEPMYRDELLANLGIGLGYEEVGE